MLYWHTMLLSRSVQTWADWLKTSLAAQCLCRLELRDSGRIAAAYTSAPLGRLSLARALPSASVWFHDPMATNHETTVCSSRSISLMSRPLYADLRPKKQSVYTQKCPQAFMV
ncbi:Uncharacterized protein APZ42_021268 [Daphnia magna]|uniref:Secreted protein n=1 Tax=Daphnia magna TaxID=35525 RepID=A0A164WTQ8_9CRUS|nr:Uncharacterized protein APZ42_021268 [Daphnia magna]